METRVNWCHIADVLMLLQSLQGANPGDCQYCHVHSAGCVLRNSRGKQQGELCSFISCTYNRLAQIVDFITTRWSLSFVLYIYPNCMGAEILGLSLLLPHCVSLGNQCLSFLWVLVSSFKPKVLTQGVLIGSINYMWLICFILERGTDGFGLCLI